MRCPIGSTGASRLRRAPTRRLTWDQVAAWMADDLNDCVEHAKKFGVLIGIQNHGDNLKTADDVLKIVKMVDSEWFGVISTPATSCRRDPYKDIARVLPYAVNWQIKERVDGAAGHCEDRPEAARADHPRRRLSGLSPNRDALDQRGGRKL